MTETAEDLDSRAKDVLENGEFVTFEDHNKQRD
jgi:hypothetical protein